MASASSILPRCLLVSRTCTSSPSRSPSGPLQSSILQQQQQQQRRLFLPASIPIRTIALCVLWLALWRHLWRQQRSIRGLRGDDVIPPPYGRRALSNGSVPVPVSVCHRHPILPATTPASASVSSAFTSQRCGRAVHEQPSGDVVVHG